jgi:hypothetical protein
VSAADAATTSEADFERLWQTKDLEIVREIVAPEAIANCPAWMRSTGPTTPIGCAT